MKERFYCVSLHNFEDKDVYAVVDAEDNSIEWYTETKLNELSPILQQRGYSLVSLGNCDEACGNFKSHYPLVLRYLCDITPDFVQSGCFDYDKFSIYFRSYVRSLDSYAKMCKEFDDVQGMEGTTIYFLHFKVDTPQSKEPDCCVDFMYSSEDRSTAGAMECFSLSVYDLDEYLTDIMYGTKGVKKSTVRGMCEDFKKWFDAIAKGYSVYESGIIFETYPPTDAKITR